MENSESDGEKTLGAFLCFAVTQGAANADIITTLVSDNAGSAATCGVGNYCYFYDVSLTTNSTTTSTNTLTNGEFGSLYDVSLTPATPIDITGDLAAPGEEARLVHADISERLEPVHLELEDPWPSSNPG